MAVLVSSGKAELLHRTNTTAIYSGPELSRDGKTIYYVDRDGEAAKLMRFDIAGGKVTELRRSSGRQIFSDPTVSTDGRDLAYVQQVRRSDVETDETQVSIRVMPSSGSMADRNCDKLKLVRSNQKPSTRALPAFLKRFFWDVDFETIQLPDQESYVIERLLEYGNDAAIRWVRHTFTQESIAAVVRNSRVISRRTANLWAMIFGISREQIRCFSIPSILRHGSFSSN
jgi:hypothetical protein